MLLPHQAPEVRIARPAQHAIEGEALLGVGLVYLIALQFLLAPAQDAGQQGVGPVPNAVFEIAFGHIQSLPVGNASDHKMGVRMRSVVVIRGDPLQRPAKVPFHLADEVFDKGGALVT